MPLSVGIETGYMINLHTEFEVPSSLTLFQRVQEFNKRLSCRRGTARRATSVEIMSSVAQLHEKSPLKKLAMSE